MPQEITPEQLTGARRRFTFDEATVKDFRSVLTAKNDGKGYQYGQAFSRDDAQAITLGRSEAQSFARKVGEKDGLALRAQQVPAGDDAVTFALIVGPVPPQRVTDTDEVSA